MGASLASGLSNCVWKIEINLCTHVFRRDICSARHSASKQRGTREGQRDSNIQYCRNEYPVLISSERDKSVTQPSIIELVWRKNDELFNKKLWRLNLTEFCIRRGSNYEKKRWLTGELDPTQPPSLPPSDTDLLASNNAEMLSSANYFSAELVSSNYVWKQLQPSYWAKWITEKEINLLIHLPV